jgi:hypothetical protein
MISKRDVLALCALLATSWACASVPRPKPSEATNTVAIAGPTLGTAELHPTSCASGNRWVFFGAQAEDARVGMGIRLVIDPIEGPVVRVFKFADDGENSIVLRRRDCTKFEFDFGRTGKSVNFVEEMKLGLDLDCKSKAGDFVVGSVEQTACL